MAKRTKAILGIGSEEIVELVMLKGDYCYKKQCTYYEALSHPRKKGWQYIIYELGFCSIKENRK